MQRGIAAMLAFVAAGPLDRCTGGSEESKPSPSTAPSTASSPVSSPAATTEDDFCKLQPYPKRCEPACKAAFAKSLKTTCAAAIDDFTKATQNDTAFAKCVTACRPPGSDGSCVGAVDRAGCECQAKCYRSLPPATIDKAKRAAHCYEPEILPACR